MKKTFNPASVRRPFGNYNHGLLVPPGASLLVTSGQLGIGLDDTVPSDVAAQAELCFEAIKAILQEAEMSFADAYPRELSGGMNNCTPETRAKFLTRVGDAMERF